MTPSAATFRKVLGRLPTGVVIVTGGDPLRPSALVCGSFMSVSLDPPLVAVAPSKSSTSWPRIAAGGHFCANVLSEGQAELSRHFSVSGVDKFAGMSWSPAPSTGAPLLEAVAAWIDCRIYQTIDAGDHWLVLGEVLELNLHPDSGALVFHGGRFHALTRSDVMPNLATR
jgi:3-hydroxy-9,10-secoandrosta-1,3,5(10)-triene-9,17-dione monooxygenase reductase component